MTTQSDYEMSNEELCAFLKDLKTFAVSSGLVDVQKALESAPDSISSFPPTDTYGEIYLALGRINDIERLPLKLRAQFDRAMVQLRRIFD